MDYIIERGCQEMGRVTSQGKLLLCWWAYPRGCENGYNLAGAKGRRKAD